MTALDLFLLLAAISFCCTPSAGHGSQLDANEFIPQTQPFPSKCHCQKASLCNPVTAKWPKQLFAFVRISQKAAENSLFLKASFPWDKVTSLVVERDSGDDLTQVGAVVCTAHAQQTRVFLSLDVSVGNANQLDLWINRTVASMMETGLDGVNIRLSSDLSQEQADKVLSSLSRSLQKELPYGRLLLSINADTLDCSPGKQTICLNYKELGEQVNYHLYLDTYTRLNQGDLHAPNGEAGCHATGVTVKQVHRWLRMLHKADIPLRNVTLGVGWLAYDFVCLSKKEGDTCTLASCNPSIATPTPLSAVELLQQHAPLQPHNDTLNTHLRYLDSTSAWHEVCFDSKAGLASKYDLVDKWNLTGLGVYRLGFGEHLWRDLPVLKVDVHTSSPGLTGGMAAVAIFLFFIILA